MGDLLVKVLLQWALRGPIVLPCYIHLCLSILVYIFSWQVFLNRSLLCFDARVTDRGSPFPSSVGIQLFFFCGRVHRPHILKITVSGILNCSKLSNFYNMCVPYKCGHRPQNATWWVRGWTRALTF